MRGMASDAHRVLSCSMWSNGQKDRVKLACLFAVLELLELTGGAGFDLLFLDEVFASLDEEGREGLFKVLEYLKGRGKGIYTIAHEPIANAVVYDSIITAYREGGLAKLTIGGTHDARNQNPGSQSVSGGTSASV